MSRTRSAPAFTPLVPPRVGENRVDRREEGEHARARGYAEGYAAGRAEALAAGRLQRAAEEEAARARAVEVRQARTAQLSALQSALTALTERIDALTGQDAERIEELALSLAAAILDTELAESARSAAHALRRALDAAPASTWVRVTFSTADAAALRADESAEAMLQGVEVIASAEMDQGGAVVELEDGVIDMRIGAALARAEAALRGDEPDHAEVRG